MNNPIVKLQRSKYLTIELHSNRISGTLYPKYIPDFNMFNSIIERVEELIGRMSTNYERVCIQAMLGTNSIKEMVIGPGARLYYKRA